MSTSRWVAAVAAAFLFSASVGNAMARPFPAIPFADDEPDGDVGPPEGFLPRTSAQAGTLCVKQCPNDRVPCDPPSFKQADGRCATQWN